MKYVHFKINAVFPDEDAEKLNAFLGAHIITFVSEQFVCDDRRLRLAIA
jgi:hypothetical protein